MTGIDARHSMFAAAWLTAMIAAGCGSSVAPGTGGDTTTTTNWTTTTASTSSTTTTTSACNVPCCAGAPCEVIDKECLGLVDNAGKTRFGLRMSDFSATAPAALSTGIVAGIVSGAVTPSDPGCHLNGGGTFTWLLQFDLTTGKLETGGAKPVADPAMGYSFVNQVLGGVAVAPIEFDTTPDANGNFGVAAGKDLVMPIFLDATATQYLLLPLKAAKITMGTLSASRNCIGHLDAEGLNPANSCPPDEKNASFIKGAKVDALITLEDADKVIVASLQQTLCVLLAGNQGVAGPQGYKVCARDASGKITFQGDSCSTGAGCGDAVKFAADFAASSVLIH